MYIVVVFLEYLFRVYEWMTWVGKESGCGTNGMEDYHIDGKTLCKMFLNNFIDKFPYGQTFYDNLELLKVSYFSADWFWSNIKKFFICDYGFEKLAGLCK